MSIKRNWKILLGAVLTLLFFSGVTFAQGGTNLIYNGDLEIDEPFFYHAIGNGDGGAQCIWAEDAAHTYFRSFKIVKPAASSQVVGWQSANFAQYLWNGMKPLLYKIGGWYKTEGVNTNPANDDQRIGFTYKFYKNGVELVSSQFIPIDQSVGTKADWDTVYTYVALPDTADSAVCMLTMGKEATGTVWFDDIGLGSSPWSAGMFGGNAETPAGWMMWTAGADKGKALYVNDVAHSGTHSAELVERDTDGDEMVFYSVPAGGIKAGHYYKISVWVKTDSVNTDDKYIASNVTGDYVADRINLCFFYHKAGWETSWANMNDQFLYIAQRDSSSGWTEYMAISKAPEEAVGISVRARFNNASMGYAWFDDFSVEELTFIPTAVKESPLANSKTNIPTKYALYQNYPNPFNPTTEITYQLPKFNHVDVSIYNVMGQKIATLVNKTQAAGTYRVLWNGKSETGESMPSGIYFYKLQTNDYRLVKKMTLMK